MDRQKIKAIEMREFLRDSIRMETNFEETDQNKGIPRPTIQKPLREGQEKLTLPEPSTDILLQTELKEVLLARKSVRSYGKKTLSMKELSWLLFATQGVRRRTEHQVFRTVPSAGNRHPFETYLAVFRVDGLKEAIYRYLPMDHALVLEKEGKDLQEKITLAAMGQRMAGNAAVTFLWSVIPYRTEWRYSQVSAKVIAMDIGHVCQNLYLACGTIGCGTCEIGAYNQRVADQLLGLDGENEFVIAMSPVGKI
ncbi:MAG: SagB/ThcOx family dehydrogenase [Tissierellia bacterium]|nr:SagB/ThcOx family dehydrogenase [Tissierellia bacterium]